jgi:YHS domain-containing protein
MSDFNWCHGPRCHKSHTQDRIRGVKGSKVLRTRKVKYWAGSGFYNYFCSQQCYNNFANTYVEQIIAIAPRTEALETPINVTQEKYSDHWGNHTNTKIEVDESRTNSIG